MSRSKSPLRYPGGKSRLANFIKLALIQNNIKNGVYVEPFAGGAGVAIELLASNSVDQAIINDIDPCIFSFWQSVLNHTEEFCNKVKHTPVTQDNWYRFREIVTSGDTDCPLELGFASFFLNRTNRSGILKAGMIGGKRQDGKWKIDARYNKDNLIERIKEIAKHRDKIELYNLDVRELVNCYLKNLPDNSLVYFDPPYFEKGQKLYLNALKPHDHVLIKHAICMEMKTKWIVSYDNAPEIREIYAEYRKEAYHLNYSAATNYEGSEIIIYSDNLIIPRVDNPFKISSQEFLNKRIQLTS